jgi:hypothetical protein
MAASKGVINVTLPFTAVTPTSSSGIIVMDHGDQIKDDNDMHHLRYIFYLIESVRSKCMVGDANVFPFSAALLLSCPAASSNNHSAAFQ